MKDGGHRRRSAGTWSARRQPRLAGRSFKDVELEFDFMLAEHGARCSAEVVGPNQANGSEDKDVPLQQRRVSADRLSGEPSDAVKPVRFIGVVVHRV
jgi:hypothetical protein